MRISPTTFNLITSLRDCVRHDEGGGGQCATVVQEIAQLPGFEDTHTTAGYFVTATGNIIDDHWWLVLGDDSIFDPTQDQFGDDGFGDMVHLSKKDPRYKHYFTYDAEPGIPVEVLQFADKIRASKRTVKNQTFSAMAEAFQPAAWGTKADYGNEWLYHATNLENVQDIFRSGQIDVHEPWEGTDQETWPDGSDEKRAYFSPNPNTAWSFAPEHGQSVVIRVPKNAGQFRRENTGDIITSNPVDASRAEILGGDGQWHHIRKTVQEASGAAPSSDANRQSSGALPDYMTDGGQEGVPVDEPDEQVRPEDMQLHLDDLMDEDVGDLIRSSGIKGFGGMCFPAAKEINDRFFNGEGRYVMALNTAFWERDVAYGHVAVEHNGVFWDADGKPKTADEIESWGMLAPDDPDYAEHAESLGFEFDDEAAETVTMQEIDEETLKRLCQMNEVDHPEFMPGGDETHGYDPNYDPQAQERASNTNTGHPKP